MPSEPLSESEELAASPISIEEFSASGPTEAFRAKAENKELAADAERRDISGTMER